MRRATCWCSARRTPSWRCRGLVAPSARKSNLNSNTLPPTRLQLKLRQGRAGARCPPNASTPLSWGSWRKRAPRGCVCADNACPPRRFTRECALPGAPVAEAVFHLQRDRPDAVLQPQSREVPLGRDHDEHPVRRCPGGCSPPNEAVPLRAGDQAKEPQAACRERKACHAVDSRALHPHQAP